MIQSYRHSLVMVSSSVAMCATNFRVVSNNSALLGRTPRRAARPREVGQRSCACLRSIPSMFLFALKHSSWNGSRRIIPSSLKRSSKHQRRADFRSLAPRGSRWTAICPVARPSAANSCTDNVSTRKTLGLDARCFGCLILLDIQRR